MLFFLLTSKSSSSWSRASAACSSSWLLGAVGGEKKSKNDGCFSYLITVRVWLLPVYTSEWVGGRVSHGMHLPFFFCFFLIALVMTFLPDFQLISEL